MFLAMLKPRPTLADVAKLAGVSPATVSRALARPLLVEGATRERIEQAAARLGYVPGGVARALASGRSMTVGVVVPTLDHAIFAKAIQALQTGLAAAGYQLIVAAHEYAAAEELRAVDSMLSRGVDALVVVGVDRAAETRARLLGAPVPVLVLWSFDPELPSIGFDNLSAGFLAAQHLVELGHRRFGMISGFLRHNDRARLRVEGVRKALEDAGLALAPAAIVESAFTFGGGRAGLAQLLSLTPAPTAIVGGNDILATGALFEARSRGIAVPEALSIVGIDDQELSAQVDPPLTTVHLPTAELGARAAERIVGALSGETPEGPDVLPIALVRRRSSGPVPPHGTAAP
jgi:LacI family transcriptional regulator